MPPHISRGNYWSKVVEDLEHRFSVMTIPPPPSTNGGNKSNSRIGGGDNVNDDNEMEPNCVKFTSPGEIVRCDLAWSAYSNTDQPYAPVVGCEAHPIIILKDATDGPPFDDDDPEALVPRPFRIHYRWSVGPARAVCFFHPSHQACIQCTVTLRCFCSNECFARGQKQLRKFYLSGGNFQIPRQSNEFSYGVPCKRTNKYDLDSLREPDVEHYRLLVQAGLVVDPEKERWTCVSHLRTFVPSKEHIGHQLQLEIAMEPIMSESQTSTELYDPLPFYNYELADPSDPLTRILPKKTVKLIEEISEMFWSKFDTHFGGTQKIIVPKQFYRVVKSQCVIPQAKNPEPRRWLPVGIFSLFAASAAGSNSGTVKRRGAPKQRIIPAGSALAESLGIGVLDQRQTYRIATYAANSQGTVVGDMYNALLSNRLALAKTIRERRLAILTDMSYASFADASISSNLRLGLASSVANDDRIGVDFDRSGSGFTVMTWNVLADIYANQDAYPYCEPHTLAWAVRKYKILRDIISLDPDVVCLQEIQADHFEDFFAPVLLSKGYDGLYKHKTLKVFRGSGKNRGGRYVCDGCATFFKVSKFRLDDNFGIEFARIASDLTGGSGNSRQDKRHFKKDNVALVLTLDIISKSKEVKRKLVVVNTHILANPEAPDVKIWQANTLTSVLTDYMEKSQTFSPGCQLGLVVCGDFNSPPNSAVYELMTTGNLNPNHEELHVSKASEWLRTVRLGHGLHIRSANGVANFSRAEAQRSLTTQTTPSQLLPRLLKEYEPEFTNYTATYVGCLDYIFFDDSCLKVAGSLENVTETQLLDEAYGLQLEDWALPSAQRPSDHISICVRFEWFG